MTLKESEGKYVKIKTIDGEICVGKVSYYTSAYDNDPDPESITLGNVEILGPEIKSIEPLEHSTT